MILRYIYILFILFIPINSFSQTKDYKFSYTIFPYFKENNTHIKIDTLPQIDQYNLILDFKTLENKPISNIEVNVFTPDTSIIIYTDTNGLIYLHSHQNSLLLNAKFNDGYIYKNAILIPPKKLAYYNYFIQPSINHDKHVIYSKSELEDDLIYEIKSCLEDTRKPEYCELENEYFIKKE